MNLPFKLTYTPSGFCTFLQITLTGLPALHAHKQPVMAPAQFATQCVEIWKSQIKQSHILQIGNRKAFSEIKGHLRRKLGYKPRAVLGTDFSSLFFHNAFSNMPICLNHGKIGRSIDFIPG